jgi:3-methylcrotonyl-CoA carboxylase alpha subunit
MHHGFKLGEAEHNVELSRSAEGYRLHLGDRVLAANLHRNDDGTALLTLNGRSEPVTIAVRGDDVFVHLDGAAWHLRYEHPLQRLAGQAGGSAEDHVRAPMPGNIVALHVEAGRAVARGDTLLVMESMKMETTIAATRDGVVEAVHFAVGQSFDRDALLLSLQPRTAEPGSAQ